MEEKLILNHEEAYEFAMIKQKESNLARCYLDITELLSKVCKQCKAERRDICNNEADSKTYQEHCCENCYITKARNKKKEKKYMSMQKQIVGVKKKKNGYKKEYKQNEQ